MQVLAGFPAPTLAAIEGVCAGGGLELALLCDLRIANESARFGIPINKIGHCLPYPAMVALVELVGRSSALEILLEGRVFGAAEAKAMGLVNRVVADEDFDTEIEAAAPRWPRAITRSWPAVRWSRAPSPGRKSEAPTRSATRRTIRKGSPPSWKSGRPPSRASDPRRAGKEKGRPDGRP